MGDYASDHAGAASDTGDQGFPSQSNSYFRPLSCINSHLGADIVVKLHDMALRPLLVFDLSTRQAQYLYSGVLLMGRAWPLSAHCRLRSTTDKSYSGSRLHTVCRQASCDAVSSLGKDFHQLAFFQAHALTVACVHLHPSRLVLQIAQGTAVSCHSADGIMSYLTDGGKRHGILVVSSSTGDASPFHRTALMILCSENTVFVEIGRSLSSMDLSRQGHCTQPYFSIFS